MGFLTYFFFLAAPRGMGNSPNQGLNSQPLQWKLSVLTTESPGKSPLLSILFKIVLFVYLFILYFGCAGTPLLCVLFSSCRKWGLVSGGGALASHCSGFSCCRAHVLGHVDFSSCGSPALEHGFNSCSTWA